MPKKIAFIRGKYLNNFELQSYYPITQTHPDLTLTGITSKHPMHQVKIPTQKLHSPADLPNFPYKLPMLNRLLTDAMYLYQLPQTLKHYDLAHARETYFHFTKQTIDAQQAGHIKKVLITCSETIPHNHEGIRGRRAFKQYAIQHATHFHTLTHKAKKCLIAEGADPDKITTIPYGIDLNQFTPKTRRTHLDQLNLLFIGRLEEQKGITHLLQAYQQLRQTHPHIKLTICGKGPLHGLVKSHGINPIQVPYDQIPKLYHQADLLIHPPKPDQHWEEYFGMVLLEAMASGLAIVTTDCGAISEVVGDTAQIAEPDDSTDLYQNIKYLLDHPNWLKILQTRAIKRAQTKYNATIQAEKLANLYCQILKS